MSSSLYPFVLSKGRGEPSYFLMALLRRMPTKTLFSCLWLAMSVFNFRLYIVGNLSKDKLIGIMSATLFRNILVSNTILANHIDVQLKVPRLYTM